MSTENWKVQQKKCSQKWKKLSDQERERYHAEAAVETGVRMEAAKQCFPATKKGPAVLGKASWDAAADLCPSAQKKISKNRLVETYSNFRILKIGVFGMGVLLTPRGVWSLGVSIWI